MRPSSLGGGRILRRTLSVCLSVRLSVCRSVRLSVCLSVRPVMVTERHVVPPSELQWHTCTFRQALRAAYRTAISAAQILVCYLMGIEASACAQLLICFALLCFGDQTRPYPNGYGRHSPIGYGNAVYYR